jgi:uncharacterized protein (DUF362 family)
MNDQQPKGSLNRRVFLRWGLALGALAPSSLLIWNALGEGIYPASAAAAKRSSAVAIVPCRSYGPEAGASLEQAFDLLGGIGSLMRGKTVTVKINLTGTSFGEFLGRPMGETIVTHFATAMALATSLFKHGAKRVRFVESTQSRDPLERTLKTGGWDVAALSALGQVEFENTRNLGQGRRYSEMKVPGTGHFFSAFQLNHSYEETDVMVSLCKLKQHVLAGVTLSMKNLFGITPNSLYGDQAGSEDAVGGRGPLHGEGSSWGDRTSSEIRLPGLRLNPSEMSSDAGVRVPRIITDICAARPVHLAIIDGITSVSRGEGWWCNEPGNRMRLMKPGVLIAGFDPVATDAVGLRVMGFENPRAVRGQAPFPSSENHLALAEKAGLGTADLARIEARGTPIDKATCPFEDRTGGRRRGLRIEAEPE